MSSVESIDGDLALEQFKIDSKSKYKCTLEEKLGALLITKDTLSKVAKEKESRPSNDDQGEPTLVVPISDTIIKQKRENRSQHLMVAMDGNDQVACISCGYPILDYGCLLQKSC